MEAQVVLSIDGEVARINVVSLEYLLKDFRLVHIALSHEADYLILDCDRVIDVVVKLYLNFVLQLSLASHEIFFFDIFHEIFATLGEQVEVTNVRPRVEAIAHRVLR